MTGQALAADLVRRESRPDAPYGMYLLHPDDPAAELARTVERQVFLEYFGNTPELLEAEYRPYEEATWFLLVLDHERLTPAGMSRVIAPSPAGSKTVDDVERLWELSLEDHPGLCELIGGDDAWDVATLAVAPGFRRRETNGVISAALLQGIVMLAAQNGCAILTATLDCVVLDLVQLQCRDPFVPFPGAEPRSYLDSPASLPVYVDRHRYERRLAEEDPLTHAFLFRGSGLEATISPPRWTLDSLRR